MMGRQTGDQNQLFYLFNLEERIPERHLLRRINPIVTRVLVELRETSGVIFCLWRLGDGACAQDWRPVSSANRTRDEPTASI